jgi:hypothetical protein
MEYEKKDGKVVGKLKLQRRHRLELKKLKRKLLI